MNSCNLEFRANSIVLNATNIESLTDKVNFRALVFRSKNTLTLQEPENISHNFSIRGCRMRSEWGEAWRGTKRALRITQRRSAQLSRGSSAFMCRDSMKNLRGFGDADCIKCWLNTNLFSVYLMLFKCLTPA